MVLNYCELIKYLPLPHILSTSSPPLKYWNENVFARPNGLREKAETAISCRGLGPIRKKKEVYQ